ncbi:fluoride efflux transporter CrcB [Salipaludibacillus sp. HK11]|uniref:fluoride efflux transporter CrcB n=1 Tax=Salipaludibacillus sp. HK11 TaxID=3394320 RepID=UPI0039FCD057
MNILIVALGGGSGAVCRYLLGLWIKNNTKQRKIPTAMLYVNLLGSLGLGVLFGLLYQETPFVDYDNPIFLLLGVGFFGAFTTFSTFTVEASSLMNKSKWRELGIYIGFSVTGCIAMFVLGMFLIT